MLVKTCKRQKAKQTLKIANFGQKFNCPQYNIIQSLGQHFDGRNLIQIGLKLHLI